MSQKTTHRTAACAAAASLLPLAGHNLLSAEDDARLREHLATCADCRAELAVYMRVETAWQRTFAADQPGEPIVSREALLADITNEPVAITARSVRQAAASPPLILPTAPRSRSRRVVAGVSALAACLLIAVIVGAALLAHVHPPVGAGPQPTATVNSFNQTVSNSDLTDISMVSATEGWAVGDHYTAVYKNSSVPTTQTDTVLLWHYLNGVWAPVQLPIHGQLESISMDSPSDGWAIGENDFDNTQHSLILLHYDGTTWKQVSSQGIQAMTLSQVQMISATNGWIVGTPDSALSSSGQTSQSSGIWHYDGSTWQAEPLPTTLSSVLQKDQLEVYSISMISATEGWATATLIPTLDIPPSPTPAVTPSSRDLSPSSVILHYTGGHWEVQHTLANTQLYSVSMLSATNGWIAGENATATLVANPTPSTVIVTAERTSPLLLHYLHGQWVNATSNISGNLSPINSLQSVVMRSASDGWMIFFLGGQTNGPTLLHYNGSQWSAVHLPAIANTSIYELSRVVITSPTEGWAVGNRKVKSSSEYTYLAVPVIYHLHNGVWSIAQS